MALDTWEYLHLYCRWDEIKKQWTVDSSGNKQNYPRLQNILSRYGQEGWELVSMTVWQYNVAQDGYRYATAMSVEGYDAFFKRRRS